MAAGPAAPVAAPTPGQQIGNLLALPAIPNAAPIDTQALLNPIYSQAQGQAATNQSALMSALQGIGSAIDTRLAQSNANMGGTSQGLAQLEAIPGATLANAQTRAAGLGASEQNLLTNQQAAVEPHLAAQLAALTQASRLQGQIGQENAQGRAANMANTLANSQASQDTKQIALQTALANLQKSSTGPVLTPYQQFQEGLATNNYNNTQTKGQTAAYTGAATIFNNLLGTAKDPASVQAAASKLYGMVGDPNLVNQVLGNFGYDSNGNPVGQAANAQAASGQEPISGGNIFSRMINNASSLINGLATSTPLNGKSPTPLAQAENLYSQWANQGNRANVMNHITGQYGADIANQVRQLVQQGKLKGQF